MKVVILAGGFGTRLSEETDIKPKPMVEIGGYPMLWHIMKIYSHYGYNDFIVCLGYRGYVIKEYFANYFLHKSDLKIDLQNNRISYENTTTEPWKISLIDTGTNTMTGGRIKRIRKYIGDETFMLTYGDGVSDVDIGALVGFHSASKKMATVTAVQPAGRFGSLSIDSGSEVASFVEKPPGDNFWINGGFFVLDPGIFDFIEGDETVWEKEPLETLSRKNELAAFKHNGFWQPMDTLRDRNLLNDLWKSGKAPWRLWDD
ncbi:MAG: glucose-1-phosphate cytidylyltransferase [Thermoplasmataceae archaeon]